MEEVWKDIEEFQNFYQISNLGRVKRKRRYVKNNIQRGSRMIDERISSPQDNGRGYKQIYVSINNKRIMLYVHRLVASYFIENPNKKLEVNHLDGNKSNNNVNNLEWVSRLENQQHAVANNLIPKGNEIWNCKLSQEKVIAIRRLFSMKNNTTQAYVCKKLNISAAQMSRIINKSRWTYV